MPRQHQDDRSAGIAAPPGQACAERREGPGRRRRLRRAVAQQPLQFRHVNRRVPVQRRGVIFHRTQMAGSRVILGRAVVYGGKVMDGVR